MANPQQRKKLRSSRYKPVRSTSAKSLRKKPAIKGAAVLQANWDKTKTVRQNYARLGLLPDPNATGVLAKTRKDSSQEPDEQRHAETSVVGPSNTSSNEAPSSKATTSGMGRIIRDSEGNVLDIELPPSHENAETLDVEDGEETPWGATMAEDLPVADVAASTVVVEELERLSRRRAKVTRHASPHQAKWLRELVAAHGDDVEAMAHDRKRNVWQHTAGQIRRALKLVPGAR